MSLFVESPAEAEADHSQQAFSLPMPGSTIANRHKGLLHEIIQAASSSALSVDTAGIASIHNANIAQVASSNSTESEQSGEHGQRSGHRPIWYMSRGFPLLCTAVVLLLAMHHGITLLRHKHRIHRRFKTPTRRSGKNEHQPLPTADPDEMSDQPALSLSTDAMSDATMVESTHTLFPRNSIEERLLDSTETTPSPPKRRGRGHYWWSAWEATQRNWLYLHTFPRWLYGPETMADALWTIAYTTLMLAFAVATIPLHNEFWHLYLANGLGVLAFCQCPLIIVLIQKNNIISFLTGITYQKLNYLHRASSRVALLFSWVHFLLWTPSVWNAGHFSHWYIIFGLIAIFGFTGLWITSFRFVRRVAFEFFLVAHIVFTIVFIGGALFHWYRLGFWMWPCFVIWGLDRLIRGSRLLYHNPPPAFRWSKTKQDEPAGQCEIRLLSQDVMLVTARRKGLRWAAGQHFFLSSPGVSTLPTESHPFSIANVPNEKDEAVFLIRVHSGFTRRLRDRLSGDITTNIPIYLEGPYGSSHSCASYSTVILVAGGTGITFLFSHLLGLLRANTPDIIRHVHLVWHIRHAQDIHWLAPLLNQASKLVQHRPSTRLTLDVHVTKSHRADEPAPAVGLTERLVEEFAPRRFSRRLSTLPSYKAEVITGDMSEMPSAVVSDDEDEIPPRSGRDAHEVLFDSDDSSPGTSPTDSETSAGSFPRHRGSEETGGADEVDLLDEGVEDRDDTRALLPKRRRSTMKQAIGNPNLDCMGLDAQAANLVSWKKGRADLREVLKADLETATGPVLVLVCGPVQLMHATRRAVRDVATPQRALAGDWPVDFFEETLGS